ncbi:hypothetical protein SynMVIR181_02630 [Synechococcus sp. MVIR-18-1]|nr:hypothetical protein SynMVIR181_02630 [Synechococcus sp. MVIR-18-1]
MIPLHQAFAEQPERNTQQIVEDEGFVEKVDLDGSRPTQRNSDSGKPQLGSTSGCHPCRPDIAPDGATWNGGLDT